MFTSIFNLFKKNRVAEPADVAGQRYNDGVLLIQQDNQTKKIIVQASNSNAQKLLGYDNNDIMGRDLREFLTESESADINEFTEFEDGQKDFAEVISKMRYFKMLAKSGDYIPLRLRVVRAISQQNKPAFQLIFNDDAVRDIIEQKRQVNRLNMRGDEIFDELTGLLSYESVLKDIEIISFYEGKRESGSILVGFEIANPDTLSGNLSADELDSIKLSLAQVINLCKREEDISAKIGDGKFLLVLVETPETNVAIPMNRIVNKFQELVAEKGFAVQPQLNVKYRKVEAEIEAEKQVSALLA